MLQRRYPDLRVELRETQTQVLVDELAAAQLDVAHAGAAGRRRRHRDAAAVRGSVPAGGARADDAVRDRARVSARDIEHDRLILLEEGHCLRDQALAFCSSARGGGPMGLGATSLATVMQMVANGYGVTLVPQVAVDVEVRDERVKLLRFASPQPGRTVGLAWRRTSPRKADFVAFGQIGDGSARMG